MDRLRQSEVLPSVYFRIELRILVRNLLLKVHAISFYVLWPEQKFVADCYAFT